MIPGQAVALIVVNSVFPLLAVISVALRLEVRRCRKCGLDWSDCFVLFALIFALLNAVACIIGSVACGIGLPLSDLSPKMQVRYSKVLWAYQFFYLGAVCSVKISILLFYRAIFAANSQIKNVVKWSMIVLIAWFVAFFLTTLFQDDPISTNWTGVGHKVNWRALYFVLSLTDVIWDAFVLTIPVFGIRDLYLPRKRRLQLIGPFLLGAVIVIASIVRLVYVIIEDFQYSHDKSNFSYMIINTVIWGSIECCTSVIAACLPIIGTRIYFKLRRGRSTFHASKAPIMGNQSGAGRRQHAGIRGKVLDSVDLIEMSAIGANSHYAGHSDAKAPYEETRLSLPESAHTKTSHQSI